MGELQFELYGTHDISNTQHEYHLPELPDDIDTRNPRLVLTGQRTDYITNDTSAHDFHIRSPNLFRSHIGGGQTRDGLLVDTLSHDTAKDYTHPIRSLYDKTLRFTIHHEQQPNDPLHLAMAAAFNMIERVHFRLIGKIVWD
jgi:hypothetical protein